MTLARIPRPGALSFAGVRCGRRRMAGVVVCHGSAAVRERIVAAAHGVPALAPVRSAASGEELIALSRRSAPALVLLDSHLPGSGPIEAMRRLRETDSPPIDVRIFVPGGEITLDRAIALGARGHPTPDCKRSDHATVAAHSLTRDAGKRARACTEQNGNHRPMK